MPKDTDPTNGLANLRAQIDQFDKQLVELLNQRASVVVAIGKHKQDHNSPVYAPDREREVLDRVQRYNQGPLADTCITAIWRELMSGSLALERALKVGYLGPPGSFSHVAAQLKFGTSVGYEPFDAIASVFDATVRSQIDLGLVPIENSAMGGVSETLDCFLDSPVRIYAEVLIRIHHNLLSNAPADQIQRVYSRPEVFSQCRRWLSENLQGTQRVAVASSSMAAEIASQEPHAAAIGSALAGQLYGLNTLFANIEDNPNNITRFFVTATHQAKPSGDDKTAITFTTPHKPGALAAILNVFREHQLNLTHIDHRPSQRANWEYCFFVDFLGHQDQPHVAQAIEAARANCLQLTVLGSFPRAKQVL